MQQLPYFNLNPAGPRQAQAGEPGQPRRVQLSSIYIYQEERAKPDLQTSRLTLIRFLVETLSQLNVTLYI